MRHRPRFLVRGVNGGFYNRVWRIEEWASVFFVARTLQSIFESFEAAEDAKDSVEPEDTNVATSQLRHFVIQVRRGIKKSSYNS